MTCKLTRLSDTAGDPSGDKIRLGDVASDQLGDDPSPAG